jgi:hypothetical protein
MWVSFHARDEPPEFSRQTEVLNVSLQRYYDDYESQVGVVYDHNVESQIYNFDGIFWDNEYPQVLKFVERALIFCIDVVSL